MHETIFRHDPPFRWSRRIAWISSSSFARSRSGEHHPGRQKRDLAPNAIVGEPRSRKKIDR
jgi:hypothetical protein